MLRALLRDACSSCRACRLSWRACRAVLLNTRDTCCDVTDQVEFGPWVYHTTWSQEWAEPVHLQELTVAAFTRQLKTYETNISPHFLIWPDSTKSVHRHLLFYAVAKRLNKCRYTTDEHELTHKMERFCDPAQEVIPPSPSRPAGSIHVNMRWQWQQKVVKTMQYYCLVRISLDTHHMWI